ncbi:hypothetical protein RUM44_009774 [Polyplax serrata]|uniref:Uncharacterized protein n=1 Tax=Polyplax serrata TaxID=468196 RepID=A0ABR1ATN1_POLSC
MSPVGVVRLNNSQQAQTSRQSVVFDNFFFFVVGHKWEKEWKGQRSKKKISVLSADEKASIGFFFGFQTRVNPNGLDTDLFSQAGKFGLDVKLPVIRCFHRGKKVRGMVDARRGSSCSLVKTFSSLTLEKNEFPLVRNTADVESFRCGDVKVLCQ